MVDPELKALLTALAEGQLKLAEGQRRTDAAVAHLATATEAALTATEEALTRLTDRIGGLSKAILEGFTNGADRDRKLDDALHVLDTRVTKLENKKPSPKKRR
jgi:hypothetical protein